MASRRRIGVAADARHGPAAHARDVTVALLGSPTRTNVRLAFAWRQLGIDARVLWPREALEMLSPGDTAIGRLDVRPALDGVEPGLESLDELRSRGVRLLNTPDAILACHDKLATARLLDDAAVPHPRTVHVEPGRPLPRLHVPSVVKPRFGSWGQDVQRARPSEEHGRILELVAGRPWWNAHGAIVQELVADARRDVRVVVAGDRVVAAAERVAGLDEWRTNVTLGGRVVQTELAPQHAALALDAARAVGIDFAGVDLLPQAGGWTVLELNGAVDFDEKYALPGRDPYGEILEGLGIAAPELAHVRARQDEIERSIDMTKTLHGEPVRSGDEIVITGHTVGDAPRTAVILEVLGGLGTERFHVRWEDGHESIYFPGTDALIRRPEHKPAKRARSTPA